MGTRSLFFLISVLTACSEPIGAPRIAYLEHPHEGIGVSLAPVDLVSARTSGDLLLRVGSERNDVTKEVVDALAAKLSVLAPDGTSASCDLVSTSVPAETSLDLAEVRFAISPGDVQEGWYEVRLAIDPATVSTTLEDRVVSGFAGTFVANRFSFFPRPTVRRVTACPADGKIRLEFSERVRPATSSLRLPEILSGGKAVACEGFLDASGLSMWLTCPPLVDELSVTVSEDSLVGMADERGVRGPDGEEFSRSLLLGELRGDGACSYFTP